MLDVTKAIEDIGIIGEREAPEEACGLLFNDGLVVQVPNKSSSPTQSFKMMAEDVLGALSEIGEERRLVDDSFTVWHTHPAGLVGPSKLDLRQRVQGVRYLVVTLLPDEHLAQGTMY